MNKTENIEDIKVDNKRETHNLASLGRRSGVNFIALAMFPLIFIFPCMKATWGLSFP